MSLILDLGSHPSNVYTYSIFRPLGNVSTWLDNGCCWSADTSATITAHIADTRNQLDFMSPAGVQIFFLVVDIILYSEKFWVCKKKNSKRYKINTEKKKCESDCRVMWCFIIVKRGKSFETWQWAHDVTCGRLFDDWRTDDCWTPPWPFRRAPSCRSATFLHPPPPPSPARQPTTIILLLCTSRRATSVRRPAAVAARAPWRRRSSYSSEFRWTRFLFQKFFFLYYSKR